MEQWKGFNKGNWQKSIDVSDFIQKNYKKYDGDDSFLSQKSKKTTKEGMKSSWLKQ